MVHNSVWYRKKVDKVNRQIIALKHKRDFYIIKAEEMRINGNNYMKTRNK